MSYDASSIKILDDHTEIPYVHIEQTARKYGKPLRCVQLAYEACMLAGLDFDDFYVKKYCLNQEIAPSEEFGVIYADLSRETDYFKKMTTSNNR